MLSCGWRACLNQLQSCLSDCLLSAFTTVSQVHTTEAEIFQLVVNELNKTLSTNQVPLTHCAVGIALFSAGKTTGEICYVSYSLSKRTQNRHLEVIPKNGKKLCLRLKEVVLLRDLQAMVKQQPQRVWPFGGRYKRRYSLVNYCYSPF